MEEFVIPNVSSGAPEKNGNDVWSDDLATFLEVAKSTTPHAPYIKIYQLLKSCQIVDVRTHVLVKGSDRK